MKKVLHVLGCIFNTIVMVILIVKVAKIEDWIYKKESIWDSENWKIEHRIRSLEIKTDIRNNDPDLRFWTISEVEDEA